MNLTVRPPTDEAVAAFRMRLGKLSPAATFDLDADPPPGYLFTGCRVRVADFAAACAALREWKPFPDWATVYPPSAIRTGGTVAILSRQFGLWVWSACRITAVFDEPDRFGFENTTLPGHPLAGAERFAVERDADGVWFVVKAFSRPASMLAWATLPFVRRVQRRFVRTAAANMKDASQPCVSAPPCSTSTAPSLSSARAGPA